MNAPEQDNSADDSIQRLARRAGPVVIVLAALIMVCWTWFGWPDPLVDFGRELYVPWQIIEGNVLYRDLSYFNGPLSPYFNALVFRLFGVSLNSLVAVNLLILALILVMIWRIWVMIADHLAATLACLLVVTVFAFIQLGGIGNYNFVTPYSHELTHGIALSLAGVLCIAAWLRRPREILIAAAGLIVGLIFLTKAEVFLAAAGALGGGVILALWSSRASPRRAMRALAQFGLSALVPPLMAFLLLCIATSPREALRGVLGSWWYVFEPQISGMRFYRRIFGTVGLTENVYSMLMGVIWWGAIFGAVSAVAIALRRARPVSHYPWVFVVSLICAASGLWALQHWRDIDWSVAFRVLAPIMIAITVGLLINLVRRGRAGTDARLVLQIIVAVFAMLLLGKMFLNVLLYHYGFALALPATLVVLALLASWWPGMIDRGGGAGAVLRGAVVAAAGLVIFVHLDRYRDHFGERPVAVARGADAFRSNDRRAVSVELMLDALRQLPASSTLASIPEGTMINYLSKRVNPTPYYTLMPPEVLMFGEDRILQAYQADPPDYIVYVPHSNPADYGYRHFSQDYGSRVQRWIDENYMPMRVQTEPVYPLVLLRRR